MATIQSRPLTETELLLLTTLDDTEEAHWMPMPDWQWRTIALLVTMLRRHALERGLRWYVAGELKISMPRAATEGWRSRSLWLPPRSPRRLGALAGGPGRAVAERCSRRVAPVR